MERLKKMQKPAGVQIEERVDARIEGKMDSTVVATVRNILADNLHPMAFKNPGSKNKKKHKSRSGNKKHKSGQSNPVICKPLEFPTILRPFCLLPSLQLLIFCQRNLYNLLELLVGIQMKGKTVSTFQYQWTNYHS